MTAAPVRADATAVRVAVDLDLPATPGERRVERAVTAIAAALWPYTSDGDLVVGVRGAGLNVDAAVTAADGARPLGSFATGLRRRSEPGRPDALVVDRVDDGDASVTAPIVLTLTPGGAELAVTSPDRDATLLAARVSHAARTVTADPQLPVEELPPSGYERDLFRAWTGAPVRYGRASVDDVVADLAARHPDRVALRHGACTLTYGELLARAEQVATRLRDRGVAPGTIMVLRLARGLDLVVAMLAALRCGAAYCAVDVEWPASRVADVLADTRAPLLVGTAPDGYDGDVPVLSMSDLTAGEPGPRPPAGEAARDPDAGFCVYFTSGSTGRPKGVLSTHRATLRTLLDPPHPRLDETVVTLSAAPLPWDAFTLELWSALLHGGTCVLAVPAHVTPAELRRAVAAGVNSLWLTASLFNVLVDEDLDAFAGVRQVLTGGERLSVPHVARFRRRHPDIILVNGYGPVEATVFATTHQITDADLDTPGGIPIGRPLPGTEVLVLRTTSGGRQVRAGTGEPGEICLAGDGLATGYVGSAAMQNEDRFPVLRLPGEPPVRVYRTGDIGLWRGDGVLLFRGRADRQVKLRGHRVEPGEIETIALRGGMVRQCA
ncbi:MAG: tycC 3, partial [Dactylosporangium sp.]|nr:tycC 3 [Dactylosporangium sp.]